MSEIDVNEENYKYIKKTRDEWNGCVGSQEDWIDYDHTIQLLLYQVIQ